MCASWTYGAALESRTSNAFSSLICCGMSGDAMIVYAAELVHAPSPRRARPGIGPWTLTCGSEASSSRSPADSTPNLSRSGDEKHRYAARTRPSSCGEFPHARPDVRDPALGSWVTTCAHGVAGERGGRIRMVSRVMVGEGTCRADHERGVGLLTDSPRRAR